MASIVHGKSATLAGESQIPDVLDERAVAIEEDGAARASGPGLSCEAHSICRTAPTTRSTPTPRMQR